MNFKSQYNRLIAKAIEMQKISPEEALEKKKGINKKIKELCLKRKKEENVLNRLKILREE